MLRILKLAKALRRLRSVQCVHDLCSMVQAVVGCFCDFSLLWCMALIFVLVYMFALIFVQAMTHLLARQRQGFSQQIRESIDKYFGSVEIAMLSLFQATTGGDDWRVFYDVLSLGGPVVSVLFIFYIAFFFLAAWNIVTSTFVQKSLRLAESDTEQLVKEKRERDLVEASELRKLMNTLRGSRTEEILLGEFLDLAENENFLDFFHVRGLDFKDADMFFRMLASFNNSDGVDLDTFVLGCSRLKGLATSIDLHTLTFETRALLLMQDERMRMIEESVARFSQLKYRPCMKKESPEGSSDESLHV
jgi:uncharacterized membrane protein